MRNFQQSTPTTPPEHTGIMTAAALLSAAGWIGLWILITGTVPTAFPRWLFFVLLYLAVTGTALPFVRFLHMRFSSEDHPPATGVIVRQSIWFGLFAVACAWLQIPRVLSPVLALFLALSLAVIEFLLHLRERS